MKQSHQSAIPATAPWAWQLAAGDVRRLESDARTRWLVLDSGRIWLTRSGRRPLAAPRPEGVDLAPAAAEDHWLDAGQRLALPAGSEWVVEASTDARLALWLPAPAPDTPAAAKPSLSARSWSSARAWLQSLRCGVMAALRPV